MLDGLRPWWIMRCISRGVCPRIYSPVGVTRAVGSNRLYQGLRWLLKGSGGSFWNGAPNPRGGHRPALGWQRPAPPGGGWSTPHVGCLLEYSWTLSCCFPWRIRFYVWFALESSETRSKNGQVSDSRIRGTRYPPERKEKEKRRASHSPYKVSKSKKGMYPLKEQK